MRSQLRARHRLALRSTCLGELRTSPDTRRSGESCDTLSSSACVAVTGAYGYTRTASCSILRSSSTVKSKRGVTPACEIAPGFPDPSCPGGLAGSNAQDGVLRAEWKLVLTMIGPFIGTTSLLWAHPTGVQHRCRSRPRACPTIRSPRSAASGSTLGTRTTSGSRTGRRPSLLVDRRCQERPRQLSRVSGYDCRERRFTTVTWSQTRPVPLSRKRALLSQRPVRLLRSDRTQ